MKGPTINVAVTALMMWNLVDGEGWMKISEAWCLTCRAVSVFVFPRSASALSLLCGLVLR